MNPTDTTAPAQTDSISFEIDLPHPPEKVWRAISDPALLSEWLLPVVGLELVPGAAFTFETQPYPGWDGIVNCRILEIEARRKLSFTWIVGDMDIDTVVTFTLAASASSGTRLSLVQSGFKPSQKQNFGGARYGWKTMGGKLVELLARIAKTSSATVLIDQRIRELGGWRGETLARMRALILEADPEMTEEWKWMGTPVWSHHGIVCTGEAYTKVVKLTFARGASIPDPSHLFNSSLEGNTRRAIDIHEGEQVDAGAFRALVKAAVARNDSVISSRGARRHR